MTTFEGLLLDPNVRVTPRSACPIPKSFGMQKKIAMSIAAFGVLVMIRLLWGPVWAFCQDVAALEVDHALTFEVQTPHIDWAKPYARGKTRVLFLSVAGELISGKEWS